MFEEIPTLIFSFMEVIFNLKCSSTCPATSGIIFSIMVYLLQVNYLHSHGLAHTELRLENVHISPIDRHIKVSTVILL